MNRKLLATGKGVFDFAVEGRAMVINDCNTSGEVKGRIVVVGSTSPDMLLSFLDCTGIICESGGLSSHVAILGMEMGVPTVVGAHGVLEAVKDGSTVILESVGGAGRLYETE